MEIERKWLIRPSDIPYDLRKLQHQSIRQAYISFSPVVRVRQLNGGERNILTVKRPTVYQGLASEESEHEIDSGLAAFLFSCSSGNVITKTRYIHPLPSGLTEEIDVFSDALRGLAYLEIEFPDIESAKSFPSPGWVLADVTDDLRYKNSCLAQYGLPESDV